MLALPMVQGISMTAVEIAWGSGRLKVLATGCKMPSSLLQVFAVAAELLQGAYRPMK